MFKGKLKPVTVSVAAAALTAVAFAAVSVAKDNDSGGEGAERGDVLRAPHPGPGGPMMFHERLSEEDRSKLEEFRQCMEDNGAPAPPRLPSPGDIENGERPTPPEPPTEAESEAIEKALEACEDKAPEGIAHGGPCGPPPGPPPSVVEPEGLKRG